MIAYQLYRLQQLLEPFLAPSASASVDEKGQKQVKELLMRAYEKEAVLLRQLSKSSEGNLHNRFLFIHQSSVVFEKVLAYVFLFFFYELCFFSTKPSQRLTIARLPHRIDPEQVEALNFLAVNSISMACMIKPSPDQDQYFQK